MTTTHQFSDLIEAIERSIGRSLGQESRTRIWDAATDFDARPGNFLVFIENDYAASILDDDGNEAVTEAFLSFRENAPIRWSHPIEMPTDAMLREDERLSQ